MGSPVSAACQVQAGWARHGPISRSLWAQTGTTITALWAGALGHRRTERKPRLREAKGLWAASSTGKETNAGQNQSQRGECGRTKAA